MKLDNLPIRPYIFINKKKPPARNRSASGIHREAETPARNEVAADPQIMSGNGKRKMRAGRSGRRPAKPETNSTLPSVKIQRLLRKQRELTPWERRTVASGLCGDLVTAQPDDP